MTIEPQRVGSMKNNPSPADPMIGMGLAGRYRILHRLGAGGMGVVYCARQTGMDREVAVKIMLPTTASDAVEVQRFLTEARLAGGLGHPHIVEVFDMGKLPDGRPYLVMPRLQGRALDDLLEKHTRLEPTHVATIVRGIASALDVLHARHIVHRDLKPQNLFLSRQADGTSVVKLLDFGLATLLGERDVRLTRTDMIVGTPQYLAPEAGDGRMLDARGDVYSLVCIAYQALSGHLPIEGATPGEIMRRKMAMDPPPLSTHGQEFNADIEAAMRRGLHYDPEQRYQRAGDFAEDFVAAVTEQFGPVPRSIHMDEGGTPQREDSRTHDLKTLAMDGAVQANLLQVFDPLPTMATPVGGSDAGSSTVKWGPGRNRVEPGPSEADRGLGSFSDPEHALAARETPARPAVWLGVVVALGLGAGLLAFGLRSEETPSPREIVASQLAERPGSTTTITAPALGGRATQANSAPREAAGVTPAVAIAERTRETGATRETGSSRGLAQAPVAVAALPSRTEAAGTALTGATGASAPTTPAERPDAATTGSNSARILSEPEGPATDRERAAALVVEGTHLLVNGQLPEAVARFRTATYANPGNLAAWRGLGLGHQRMGQNPEARSAFERYLRMAPNARDADMIRARLESL